MKNLILYIIVIFFHIAVNVICQQYVPKARCLSTATLIGDKIFFLGGLTSDKTNDTNAEILKDFFYLNLSKSFTSEPLSFVDLSNETSEMTPFFGAATAVFGEKNESIFLFGGNNTRNPTDGSNSAYSYNTTESLWKIVNVKTGPTPSTKRILMGAVTDNSGKIYIFGGGYVNTTDPTEYYSDEIDIFDTKSQLWISINYDGGVSGLVKRDGHTATFVPGRGIVYIGGVTYDGGIHKLVTMDNLDVYDTVNATWTKWATQNLPPEQRYGHTAVLTSDGRIIIFGGAKINFTTQVDNRYVVLDTNTSGWIPGTGDISIRAPFKHHTATIYNDSYMFIAFGVLPGNSVSNKVVIFQIRDGADFTELPPTISSTPPASPSHEPDSSNRKSIIIGATLGSILGIVTVLGFVGLIIFRKYKKAHPIVVQTP